MCPAPWNNDPLPAQYRDQQEEEDHEQQQLGHAHSDGMVGVSQPTRGHALSHPTVDAPICVECQALEMTFYDPLCKGCRKELMSPESGVAHVFAVLRQWVPQVG